MPTSTYASGIPGWKTDRGRIYIMYGPPDEIESHPSGGTYERPMEEGGGETSTYPFEDWRYRYIEGIGNNIIIEFVDPTMSGEYHMTMDPSEKDALLYVPGAGLTLARADGAVDQDDSASTARTARTSARATRPLPESMNEFTRLEQFAKLQKPPAVKFKDLEAEVSSKNHLQRAADEGAGGLTCASPTSTVLANVTVQFDNKDLQFQHKDGVSKATVNIFGRITSMTRRVVNTFEDPVVDRVADRDAGKAMQAAVDLSEVGSAGAGHVPAERGGQGHRRRQHEQLRSGLERVPHFDDEKLARSTLILADMIEKVPTRSIGAGQFVIGDTKVRPRVGETFQRDEKMGIYLQLYNFGADEKTQKPNGNIEYQVVKNGSNQTIFDVNQDVKDVPGASAQQVTVEKILPLVKLEPGQYTLKMKVTDRIRNQVVTPSATFTVD